MEVHVLLFGITREIVGKQHMTLSVPDRTLVSDFKKILNEKYAGFVDLNSIAIAVNSEYARDDQLIHSQDEIALIPPVSGG